MSDAELRDKCVDGTKLHASSSARVAKACCSNVVFTVRLEQCERRETFNYLLTCLGARESLQKLLQDEAGGNHDVRSGKRFLQRLNFGFFGLNISPQRQRPNACINQERHFRDRSAL